MNNVLRSGAEWIWAEEDTEKTNQYAEFRRQFHLNKTPGESCTLFISADKDYAVWLNNEFVSCGQFSDYPESKTYDVLNVTGYLKEGNNTLSILVYCQGESSSTYRKGKAGLWYVLDCGEKRIVSDEQTLSRLSPAYKNGAVPKITGQLSFTYEYDARMDDSWRSQDYAPGEGWTPSVTYNRVFNGQPASLGKRPISKLVIGDRINTRIIAQGRFIRLQNYGDKTVAQLMQTDYLSPLPFEQLFDGAVRRTLPADAGCRLKDDFINKDNTQERGIYLILDLGREEAGLFELELECGEGTVVDIGYGEHLEDMRVRTAVGGRNFANRYISREGRQHFIHYTTRLGGRYIQLHISNIKDKFILYYAGIKPTEYPVVQKGSFTSPNSLWNRIYDVSVRTLHLCMHEHYEDTPWREQALYSMDSRNEALCGYYCFGEYDFPEASFDLLGKGLADDGYLELCAPAKVGITIPCFSMAWIMEAADHYLFSGRLEPVRRALPRIKYMLEQYAKSRENNLLLSPQGQRYWHFYEWADGLDGDLGCHNLQTERWDAPLNAFYIMALDAASYMAKAAGDICLADAWAADRDMVRKAVRETFWDEEQQVFLTYAGSGCEPHYAELTQALIICAGACSEQRASILRSRLAQKNNGLVETTLSHSIYKFEVLMQEPEKYAGFVFNKIENDWGYMLLKGATSFWETIKGASDFSDAGSLCHGWSAIPVYFYQRYLLGVKPVEPGFRVFRLEPVTGILDRASGKVPTPYGDIAVGWIKQGDKIICDIDYPESIKCIRLA
ncbi:MAG TPA: family 78 glycoside hydrolase catalytic domain [Clostridiales bacterium]|nr:family 78 glycoside hydrolase catalytic domain [Clostridiales bacterium]